MCDGEAFFVPGSSFLVLIYQSKSEIPNPKSHDLPPSFPRAGRRRGRRPHHPPSGLLGQNAPSKRITMGFIGMGNRGIGVMEAFLNHADVQGVAVCDVETTTSQPGRQAQP